MSYRQGNQGMRVYSQRIGITPMVGNHGTPLFKGPAACYECGFDWTTETLSDGRWHEIADHMTSVHGYKREGAQIFKSHPCAAADCKKAGIYQAVVGGYKFCSDHKSLAVDRARLVMMRCDAAKSSYEERANAEDRATKDLQSLHATRKARG